jgi:hypothetical protein
MDQVPANRLGQGKERAKRAAQMSDNKHGKNPARTNYSMQYLDVQDSKSFRAMRPLAQLLVMKAKRFYDRKTQGPIRVSARTAAKLVKTTKDIGLSLCKEAVHYGFWHEYSPGHLGSKGNGIASSYQLTDEMFMGKPATLDFMRWDGTPFHDQHTPAYYKRKEQSLARLKAFKSRRKNSHKKTEPRPRHTGHPVPDTQDTPVPDTQDTAPKVH